MGLNVSEVRAMKTLLHPTWGVGQGIEILAPETRINPVEIQVAQYSVRNWNEPSPNTGFAV